MNVGINLHFWTWSQARNNFDVKNIKVLKPCLFYNAGMGNICLLSVLYWNLEKLG